MPRTPHPADVYNTEIIARAIEWSAFTQAGGRIVRHFATRAEAHDAAQLLADHFQRPALIYAIDAMGRSAVASTVEPHTACNRETKMTKTFSATKTFSSHFNAARGARRALGSEAQEGRDFLTKKRNGAWVWQPIEPAPEAAEAIPTKAENSAEPEAPLVPAPPLVLHEAMPGGEPVVMAEPITETAVSIADLSTETHPSALSTVVSATAPKRGKRAALEDAARRGELPPRPDFSAPTHARYRAKLDRLVAMAEAGDMDGLKAAVIKPISSSPKAMARYRDLAILAIEARRSSGRDINGCWSASDLPVS